MTLSIDCIATTFGMTHAGDVIRLSNGEVGIVGYCHSKKRNVLASFSTKQKNVHASSLTQGYDRPAQVTRVVLENHEFILSFGSEFDFQFDLKAGADKVFLVDNRIPMGALVVNEHGVSVIASDGRQNPAPVEISFIAVPSDRERYNQSAFHVLEWQIRHRAEVVKAGPLFSVVARVE